MTNVITRVSLAFLLIAMTACESTRNDSRALVITEFGKGERDINDTGVELELDHFDNWADVVKYSQEITCNDYIPKVTVTSGNLIRTVYFKNPCAKNFSCILIKFKNTIRIHNDAVSKDGEHFYTLDSLHTILKKDLENYGKNPLLADHPDKLLIYLSYSTSEFKNAPNTLEHLTRTYERITGRTDLNVWLDVKTELPPPPPLFTP